MQRIHEASFEDETDRLLMKQRYRGAQTSLCANSDEPRVEIFPHVVFYRETLLAPFLFNDVYSEQIAKWERHCEKTDTEAEYLHVMCFFTCDIYDVSSTVFADDITKRTVTNTLRK